MIATSYTADTVTWTSSGLRLTLPGGAEVHGESRRATAGKPAAWWWKCSRCEARSAEGLRHGNADDQRTFRAFLAEHAGATCPPPAAVKPPKKRRRARREEPATP